MPNSPGNRPVEGEKTQRSRINKTSFKIQSTKSPKSPNSKARTTDGSIISAQDPRNPTFQSTQTRSFSAAFPNFVSKADQMATSRAISKAPYSPQKLSSLASNSNSRPDQSISSNKMSSSSANISALQKTANPPMATDLSLTASGGTGTQTAPSDASQAGQTVPPQEEVAVDLSMNASTKIQFCLGLAAAVIFVSLAINLMVVDCWVNKQLVNWVKGFAMTGAVTGIVVAIYTFYEKASSYRKGMANCLFPTCLVSVSCVNLIGGYLSLTCICYCKKNAISDGGQDFWIFLLEILGSSCLLVVLLVFSMAQ